LLNGSPKDADPAWNKFSPGHKIAMPKPLADGVVDYTDGSPGTVQQYAKDVTAFLMWAAEPKLEERKKLGMSVLGFLSIYALLLFAAKKKIWSRTKATTQID